MTADERIDTMLEWEGIDPHLSRARDLSELAERQRSGSEAFHIPRESVELRIAMLQQSRCMNSSVSVTDAAVAVLA